MDDLTLISNFTKTLTSFIIHLQSTSQALKDSISRRPIPLDSAASTFISNLNRRISSASNDLNVMESMVLDSVSFEELLGHCNELYNKIHGDFLHLECRFKEFGYVPEAEIDEDKEEIMELKTPESKFLVNSNEVYELKTPESKFVDRRDGYGLISMSASRGSMMKRLKDDHLLDESLSLQNLGLSDVCLATLASEADKDIYNLRSLQKPTNYDDVNSFGTDYPSSNKDLGAAEDHAKSVGGTATRMVINIAKDEYEKLPSFMKSLASFEDLNQAVNKMNSILASQKNTKEFNFFHQDKLASFGLGPKVRSYLMMLVRMQCLVVETVDGSVVYRVL
ncbi:hypothetical protein ACHQM5_013283 [Ranunculus cassubicifolius]